jgi:hypothetical protein
MPTFFFHIRGGGIEAEDFIGMDLPSLEAARDEAVRSARDIMMDEIQAGRLSLKRRIDVEDQDQRPVFSLPFGEAIILES